jgi:hypothetical protein
MASVPRWLVNTLILTPAAVAAEVTGESCRHL